MKFWHSKFFAVVLAAIVAVLFFSHRSAYAQFTNYINIPAPDPSIGDFQFIGSNTQLNLSVAGSIGHHFNAGASDGTSMNVEVNITGGSVDHTLTAYNGSTINISDGSVGSHFAVTMGSTVNISGGSVGNAFLATTGSEVNVSGGSIGRFSQATRGGIINISGGSIGDDFAARDRSVINISGGSFGESFEAHDGSTINMSGGSNGDFFVARSGSTVNFSGGSIGDAFNAESGSEINIIGNSFALGGIDITGTLVLNSPFIINDRNLSLTGLLADGSPFAFILDSTAPFPTDYFASDATVKITLVPEPTTLLLAVIGLLMGSHRRKSLAIQLPRATVDFADFPTID